MRNASWVIVLAFASAPVAAQEKTIEPGLYEIVTRSTAGTQTVKKCLTGKDITSGLMPELDKGCKRLRSTVAGGKMDFATTCPDMSMTMTGTYTPTSYVIDGKVTMTGEKDPVMESHIAAKRLAASC